MPYYLTQLNEFYWCPYCTESFPVEYDKYVPLCKLAEFNFIRHLKACRKKTEALLKKFKCVRCGNCCQCGTGDGYVTDNDIKLWKEKGRHDILAWVDRNTIWINPRSGEHPKVCPWLKKSKKLKKFVCIINDVKPEMCLYYPHTLRYFKYISGCKGEWDGRVSGFMEERS